MQVEMVELDSITPYHRNPRKNDPAISKVAQSIERYGFNVPITVDKKDVIVTGHTRYLAARRLGIDKVPVVRLDLTKRQATEYRIADNKTQEYAKWDQDLLIDELRLVGDLEDFQGFFIEDLASLLTPTQTEHKSSKKTTVVETEAEHNTQFDNVSDDQVEDMIEIPCPHCNESSFISKSDMLSRLGIKG